MAAANLQPIIDEVTKLTSAVDSVEALLTKLTTLILAAPTLAEAKAVASAIQSEHEQISAAVVANTPADEPA